MNHSTNLKSFVLPFCMMFTNLCRHSKVVSCGFSVIKNILASPYSGLPMKLICCFKSWFSNSICLLKSMQLVYYALKNIHNPINYQLYGHYFYSFLLIFSHVSSLFFTHTSKKLFPSINTLKSFISTFGV